MEGYKLTSEQRRIMAREWHSKHVPMEDITRLLGISEEEVLELIREPAEIQVA